MSRPIRPATPETGLHLEQVLLCLQVARHHARLADCPATLRKIRTALKSAEGAKWRLVLRLAAGAPAIAPPEESVEPPRAAAPEQFLTAGVDALPSDVKAMVIRTVATFSDFTADND